MIKNPDKTNRIQIGSEDLIIRNKDNNNETVRLFGKEGSIVIKDRDEVHSFGFHSGVIANNNNVAGLWVGASQAEAAVA